MEKGTLVKVTFLDSTHRACWIDQEEAEAQEISICVIYGWVVNIDKKKVTIGCCQSNTGYYTLTMSIPLGAVTSWELVNEN